MMEYFRMHVSYSGRTGKLVLIGEGKNMGHDRRIETIL